ncbi:MAG TPA: 30S ribosomal protein S2 [Phycisphaeraceae bacterium]|nr:30S ribosomal protein S2 [Phycisphaeraceae bacterium]
MADNLIQDLIEAGIHFGQRASNWNPKMAPYIYGKRNQIHIIDIKETVKGLLIAKKFLTKVVADGKDVCFVGTKRQAKPVIEQHVSDVGMHWVTERWLGGTLTNHRTIRSRLKRLVELENLIESGEIKNYSKKMESQLLREKKKIHRNLSGIRNMASLPGAVVVVDVKREINALREARKLGIPTVALIDTDGDPDMIDIPIPGNDDSMRSIDVVIRELCSAIAKGKTMRREKAQGEDIEDSDKQPAPRKRSSRAKFRADDSSVPEEAPLPEPETTIPGSDTAPEQPVASEPGAG